MTIALAALHGFGGCDKRSTFLRILSYLMHSQKVNPAAGLAQRRQVREDIFNILNRLALCPLRAL